MSMLDVYTDVNRNTKIFCIYLRSQSIPFERVKSEHFVKTNPRNNGIVIAGFLCSIKVHGSTNGSLSWDVYVRGLFGKFVELFQSILNIFFWNFAMSFIYSMSSRCLNFKYHILLGFFL